MTTFTGITLNGARIERSKAILEMRKRRGLTRKELQEISHVSSSSIVRYERSGYKGQDATFLKILRALGGQLEVNVTVTFDPSEEIEGKGEFENEQQPILSE